MRNKFQQGAHALCVESLIGKQNKPILFKVPRREGAPRVVFV